MVAWNLTAASEPVACGAFRTGDAKNLWNIAWDCKFGRGSNFEVPRKDSFTVKGTKCFRIACWNTSGIYVCSLLSPITPPPAYLQPQPELKANM